MGSNPFPGSVIPVESIVARHIVARAAYLALPLVALAWFLRGPEGAFAGALGLVIVVLNLWLAGKVLSLAMRVSLTMYHAAALVGFFLRMALIAGAMLLVVRFVEIDRYAFGISAVVSYVVLITLEAISIMRDRERKLDWTS
ncbi:MAG TPA: ATP synthase subunit I [Acidimicrobiia bacterium]|nr:ATP synthase subunit I [Acidimicrobiia bacterium]